VSEFHLNHFCVTSVIKLCLPAKNFSQRPYLPAKFTNQLNYNYFSEIEETFIRWRGSSLQMSPLDWALMENWHEREVPLTVVIRSIETVFIHLNEKPKQQQRARKKLVDCQAEVEKQYKIWRQSQVGNNQTEEEDNNTIFSPEAIAAHLTDVTAKLKNSSAQNTKLLSSTIKKFLGELEKLKNKRLPADKLEESLIEHDQLLDKALIESIDTENLNKLELEIAKQLSSYRQKMNRDVYQRTFDLMLLKQLRERAEIPRLSLFYL
jgi:hypothetical protein